MNNPEGKFEHNETTNDSQTHFTQGNAETLYIEYEAPNEKKRTKKALVVITVIIVLLICVVLAIGAVISNKLNAVQTIDDPFQKIDDFAVERPEKPELAADSVDFLILGSDSRISTGDASEWQAGAQRTDAIMILHIAGDGQSVSVMSIPRDSWVEIPGHGEAKINAAFSYGGPALSIATVEQLTGIRIDHIAALDFTSFKELTDAIGGVTMTTATEGTKHYSGKEALAFVRERKHLPGGDFDRVRRQQLWMKAVLSQTLTKENLSNPTTLMNIYNALSPYIAVDTNLALSDLLDLATKIGGFTSENVNFFTAPYTGTGRSADGQSIVLLDEAKLKEVCQAIIDDDVAGYLSAHQGELQTLNNQPVN